MSVGGADTAESPRPAAAQRTPSALLAATSRRIPAGFQLLVALYILLTGVVPIIIQASAFGVTGGASNEFAVALVAQTLHDLLLIAPLLILASNSLGILHPLLLAVVLWPLVAGMPTVIQDYGGWAGVFSGLPISAPHFDGLAGRSTGAIWNAIAKHNGVRSIYLLSIYVGFLFLIGKQDFTRRPIAMRDPRSIRGIMIALIAVSLAILIVFIRVRGGINAHLTSLGAGRYQQLAGDGIIIVAIDIGEMAIFVWLAALPQDVKSPVFLAFLGAVCVAEFVSNGSRGAALQVLVSVGLIWALMRQKIPWKVAFILLPFMFLSIGLLGAIRTSSWSGSTADQTLSSASWSESLESATTEIEQRVAAAAPVPVVARGIDVTNGPLLGQSYLVVLTEFIPRAIWRDKPRGVGSLYAQRFLGAPKGGTTIPVGPEAELYWNFGLPGVVVFALIYGILIRVVYNFFWRRYPDPFVTVFYVTFLTGFTFCSDILVGFEQQIFLLFVCYACVNSMTSKVFYVGVNRPRQAPVRAPQWSGRRV